MKTITDIAKSDGGNTEGKVGVRKQLKRARVLPYFTKLPPSVVGIEACASSHYWARDSRRSGMR
jgi:transposase